MPLYKILILLTYLSSFPISTICQESFNRNDLDVLSYHVTIEPEIAAGSIAGTVIINFQVDPKANSIVLNAGNLHIDNITGKDVIGFKKSDDKLFVKLSEREESTSKITIDYHGNPHRGLLFNGDLDQAYTVYFTSGWMVCNDLPSDKATLNLNLLIPKGKRCIGSGELIGTEEKVGKTLFRWIQQYETPTYTYGFAIGNFNENSEKTGDVKLNYYSQSHSDDELKRVFKETGNILKFFEEKSGVKYVQQSYSQILVGTHFQEMSGFSVLKDSYANAVIKDSTEIHLISHELAHQWWGNMITCRTFQHFWLNEAFATYMSSAFSEYRFGKGKYEADITIYRGIYDDISKREKDKPLVFPSWDNPSKEDRNIVYYKGAYVLHLLRVELGDDVFWKGIKSYSRKFFGKSVETYDFQQVMEVSAGRDLDAFFKEWVY